MIGDICGLVQTLVYTTQKIAGTSNVSCLAILYMSQKFITPISLTKYLGTMFSKKLKNSESRIC